MRSVSVRLSDLEKRITIPIGFMGENEHTHIFIDCKKVFDDYPSAVPSMTVQPPEGDAYPAVIVRDGDIIEWEIVDSDLVYPGSGEFQLTFTIGDTVAKSFIGKTKVLRSLEPSGEAPEPIEDWITRADTALSGIPQAIDDEFDAITAEAETLPAGSSASASFDSETKKMSFGIPKGDKGDPGDPGDPGSPGQDGYSPTASVTKSGNKATITITDKNGTTTAEVTDGTNGHDGQPGQDGQDGFSPTVSVTDITGGHRVTITDKTGTSTFDVMDGEDGQPGQDGSPGADGFSPVITVTDITGGHRLTITTASGTQTVDVMDGASPTSIIDDTSTAQNKVWSANKTNDLKSAITAKQDAPSSAGTAGQVLGLDSNLDPVWTTPQGGGGVSDVQVNGTSIVSQGVANVPVAGSNTPGVIAVNNGYGIAVGSSNNLYLTEASSANIKGETGWYNPITSHRQNEAVFYGLAKAAGDSTQSSSSNAVGTYTEDAKSSIFQMLNAPETVSGTTPSITAKSGVRYICGEVATLTVVVPASGIIDVVFESGSTATVLTVTPPTGVTAVKWANGFNPASLEANTKYEISIMDGELGAALSWT